MLLKGLLPMKVDAKSILLHPVFTMRSIVVLFYMHLQGELHPYRFGSNFTI